MSIWGVVHCLSSGVGTLLIMARAQPQCLLEVWGGLGWGWGALETANCLQSINIIYPVR